MIVTTSIVVVALFLVPLINGGGISGYIKQIVLLGLNVLFSYLLINAYSFNLEKILKDYFSILNILVLVVFVQFASLMIGFHYGADFSYLGFEMGNFSFIQNRTQAWFQEPSFLVYAMMPALFVALARFFNIHKTISRFQALLILIAFLLSVSSVGFIGLLISLLIIVFGKFPILKKPLYLAVLILLVPITSFFLYQIPDVKERVDDSIELFFKEYPTTADINKTNLSTYALYSNFRVTQKTYYTNPFLGTGLGSYEYDYDKYITQVIPESPVRERYQLNKKDANSLFFRLLAETGLIGLFFFCLYLYNKRVRFNVVANGSGFLWALSNGIFVLVLIRLLRQGHYTSLGFVLFLLLYYYLKNAIVENERDYKTF
ncbi:O-antigen ligase family protein [Zobellia nedashkovskayae]